MKRFVGFAPQLAPTTAAAAVPCSERGSPRFFDGPLTLIVLTSVPESGVECLELSNRRLPVIP